METISELPTAIWVKLENRSPITQYTKGVYDQFIYMTSARQYKMRKTRMI
uniref:Uncharacterized protein n=1 Tax=Rhizophora mucronata TaxID=61149 RepID=A0A2P2NT93_RHIMU